MPPKRERCRYDPIARKLAVWDYKNGMHVRDAAKKHGVPPSTIQDHKNDGIDEGQSKFGPKFTLHADEEQQLVKWSIDLAKLELPMKTDDLLNTVQRIMVKAKRPNRFRNNRPGVTWKNEFFKRHPEIVAKNSKRATGNNEKWFKRLQNHLKTVDDSDILLDPRRVFMAVESNFSIDSQTDGKVIPKRWKNVYQSKSDGHTITVLLTFSAFGDSVLPFVVLPQSPPKIDMPSVPIDWLEARSDSGWMESETFHTFMQEGFSKLVESDNVPKPVLLLVDGQTTHLTLEVSQFCDDHQIILYGLPSNSIPTPFHEPFRGASTKEIFFPRIEALLGKDNLPDLIENGFRKLGLYATDELNSRRSAKPSTAHAAAGQKEEGMKLCVSTNESLVNGGDKSVVVNATSCASNNLEGKEFQAFMPMLDEILVANDGDDPESVFNRIDMSTLLNEEVEPLYNLLDKLDNQMNVEDTNDVIQSDQQFESNSRYDDSQSTFNESEMPDDNIEYKRASEPPAVDVFNWKTSGEFKAEYYFKTLSELESTALDNDIQAMIEGDTNGLIRSDQSLDDSQFSESVMSDAELILLEADQQFGDLSFHSDTFE